MQTIVIIFINTLLWSSSAWSQSLPVNNEVTAGLIGSIPNEVVETLLWTFLTLAILKICSSGLFFIENKLLESNNWFIKGLGYVAKSIRASLDTIIANTRKMKIK